MSRTERARPTGAALLIAAIVGMLGLTGCGAGQIAQTAREATAASGGSVTVGDIAVRDARIGFPANGPASAAYLRGASALVALTIVNESYLADRLVSVSSPAAASVLVVGNTSLPGHQALVAGGSGASLTGVKQIGLTLVSLNQDIRPGLTYPLVLTFERAGPVTVDLPVGEPAGAAATAVDTGR